MSVNNSLVCWGLEKFANEEQKQKYLDTTCERRKNWCFCLSEPEAGSDATSQRTTAIDMGDHYFEWDKELDHKWFICFYLFSYCSNNVETGHKGINAFIVERGMEGFE